MIRVMLYEAAQSMMRSKKWSWLKAWAMQIASGSRAQEHNVCRGVQDAINQVSKSLQRARLFVVVAMPIVDCRQSGS